MSADKTLHLSRRVFLGATTSLICASALPALAQVGSTEFTPPATAGARNNVSGFRMPQWQDHFDNTQNGIILCDINSRALHYWSEDQAVYKLFPSSVPLREDLTRRGRTSVIQKVENPTWRPTQNQLAEHPDWPTVVEGGSPDNPLGVRALYLDWPAYRIHGTHDTRKIGRRSSGGCIGLYNEHILELYALAKVGTQVLLI